MPDIRLPLQKLKEREELKTPKAWTCHGGPAFGEGPFEEPALDAQAARPLAGSAETDLTIDDGRKFEKHISVKRATEQCMEQFGNDRNLSTGYRRNTSRESNVRETLTETRSQYHDEREPIF